MRDLASCFSEYAVQVSDTSCSTQSTNSCISPTSNSNSIPSVQNSVTCLYRTLLSSHKHLLITLTWCRNAIFQGLNVAFAGAADSAAVAAVKVSTNSRLFRKLKGTKLVEFQGLEIEISWDLTSARYESGPEPVDGYYILVTIDSETALTVGGAAADVKPKSGARTVKSTLISRREHFSGSSRLYATRARFRDGGSPHDIVIRCTDGGPAAAMAVCIDKKTVIRVKRLQWNFRGNQTIFLDDGMLVDLMWDVHDWFYGGAGAGVFMFRTRSGMESRLWLEEKMQREKSEEDKVEFSLVMLACKNT